MAWTADSTRAVFVAKSRHREIVGVSMCRPYFNEPGFDVQLSVLYVLQKAQGFGFGRDLLGAAASEFVARGFRALTLNVIAANINARRFYEHLGAEFVRDVKMHEAHQTWTDAVYGWRDITALFGDGKVEKC